MRTKSELPFVENNGGVQKVRAEEGGSTVRIELSNCLTQGCPVSLYAVLPVKVLWLLLVQMICRTMTLPSMNDFSHPCVSAPPSTHIPTRNNDRNRSLSELSSEELVR